MFYQFCGGKDLEESRVIINKMGNVNVHSVLDYGVEGRANEKSFVNTEKKILEMIDFAKDKKFIPFVVFKLTGIGSINILKKKSSDNRFTDIEKQEWQKLKNRFYNICSHSYKNGVSIMIDAEESWIQKAIDELVEEQMRIYNKEKVLIYNTVQMYRNDRMEYLTHLKELSKKHNFKVGVKLVRGAYMEKERKRAIKLNYPSVINETKKATDNMYNTAIEYIFDNINIFNIYIGTHNEKSCIYLTRIMKEKNISKDDKKVWIGQLLGMSDQVTFNMADSGYNVTKYIPFGPINKVVPYLIRRLEENSSVSKQINNELTLIKKELIRRKNQPK